MSKLQVGQELQIGGSVFKVRAFGSNSPGKVEAVIELIGKVKQAPERAAPAPGLASQLLTEALDPLKGARHLGYLEGLQRGAELCEAHGIASGRSISVLIRNHAEAMRREPLK